ncbi:MAG TPA: metallophosphoesterase [Thermoanaerobaculia bacterium]
MLNSNNVLRIAAVGDIHCAKSSQGLYTQLFVQASEEADVLLLAGDLTDYGLPDEARVLAHEIAGHLRIPVIAVLGNHDFESGKEAEVKQIFIDSGVVVLDGDSHEIEGVGFAGVKGFVGGFGRRALAPWGEASVKALVHEAIDEALKLENALARLRQPPRVVLMHYAPIHATVVGEPDEIIPFLGSSRLEDPIDRYRASVVFHGHAHHGAPEGKTKSGVPVYNVAFPLMKKLNPERPFFVYEIARPRMGETPAGVG